MVSLICIESTLLRLVQSTLSCIASVKNTSNSFISRIIVVSEVLEIRWNPSPIHKNCLNLIIISDVSIVWSDAINSLLSVFPLFNLDIHAQVEVSIEDDWLPLPIVFELLKILSFPWEISSISWCDINWSLIQSLLSTFQNEFRFNVKSKGTYLSSASLILSSLRLF
jgi:hypothetical protein